MIRTTDRSFPRAICAAALVAGIAIGATAPATAEAGHRWPRPAQPAPTTTPETTTVIGGGSDPAAPAATAPTDDMPSTEGAAGNEGSWTGAGGGWNGGSWREPSTTWTPSKTASVQLRALDIDRPAISPNGDGEGDTVDISLRLARASADVRVLVRDAAGATVRDLGAVRSATRWATITWDGTNDAGTAVPDGSYAIAIVAAEVPATTAPGTATTAATHEETLDITVDVDTSAPRATANRPSLFQLKALAKRAAQLRDATSRWNRARSRRSGHDGHGRTQHRGSGGWSNDEQRWIDLWLAQQLRIPMNVTLAEDAEFTVTTKVGAKTSSFSTWREGGRHTLNIGFPTYASGATATVTFAVSDDAGNAHRHTVSMKLPVMPAAPRRTQSREDEGPSGGGSGSGGGNSAAPVTNVPTNTKGPLPDWLDPIMQRATYAAGVPLAWASSNALYQIISHESSFRPTAQNPTSTAYGMFQFLNTTWATVGCTKTSDAYQQSVCGLRYIQRRYRTPEAAWKFWQANHWY